MSADQSTNAAQNDAMQPAAGTRRGTLAALLAGSALGLAALGGTTPAQAAKRKKARKGKNGKQNKGGNGGKDSEDSLPSIRYVYNTTTFNSIGIVTASATCPDGYLPINAGLTDSFTDSVNVSSFPQLENNSWEFELDGAQPQHQATVIAVCLAASDDTTVDDTEHRSSRRKRGKPGRKK